ncbi:hypothetical protein DNTS_023022 [Danionella cerebrum]|uniref:NACHT domain-containing protein n=1 Tax=Danionella cerebrum TaxID=2873325 RepID=A0A553QLY0_9TELE|nr:hypothetical protein DNTS_023022 [Danionella translucida]
MADPHEAALGHYRGSVKAKYGREEKRSSITLTVKPQIIQKYNNGSFKMITTEDLLETCRSQTVVLQGDFGSGKSFIAQQMFLDWAVENTGQFSLVFHLRCEELMCSGKKNLIKLLSCSSLPSEEISRVLQASPEKVLFIIDGFDELRLTQDIFEMSTHTHPLQKAPPEVILCALLRGCLIPASKLLVTSRTKTTLCKLLKGELCFTEVLGVSPLSDLDLKEIFRSDHHTVTENITLLAACSSPVVCCILKEKMEVAPNLTSGLETTTSIYADFVSTQLEHTLWFESTTILMSLGELAEAGMLNQEVLLDKKKLHLVPSHENPLLGKFLSEKTIRRETKLRFHHLSFQPFFTAFFYVLLESQKKVEDLLNTVAKGWALSCWTSRDFSSADVEVRLSENLQSVIPFLCGLCKTDVIPSFFAKQNIAVPVDLKNQLKNWITYCSQRFQKQHMLFLLHCLHELHDVTFTKKVLEDLTILDLSDTPLNTNDCLVLKFCLESCRRIRNMKLHIASHHLKVLESRLLCCEELTLTVDHISGDVSGLISNAVKEKNKLKIPPGAGKKVIDSGMDSVSLGVLSVDQAKKKASHREENADNKLSFRLGTRVFLQLFILVIYDEELGRKKETSSYSGSYSSSDVEDVKETQQIQSDAEDSPSVSDEEDVIETQQIQSDAEDSPSFFGNGFRIWSLIRRKLKETRAAWTRASAQPLPKKKTSEEMETMNIAITSADSGFHSLSDVEDLSSFSRFASLSWRQIRRRSDVEELSSSDEEDEIETQQIQSDAEALSSLKENRAAWTGASSQPLPKENTSEEMETMNRTTEETDKSSSTPVQVFSPQLSKEDEVLYRIASWDPELLDGLGQKQPAGPLYNIECLSGSISGLHLPHCEIISVKTVESLSVAHFTGGNVELLKPLEVTQTHVVFHIRDLSLFGLIKSIFFGSPIGAQVLLFLRPFTPDQRDKILNVHLLPKNVPVSEVRHFHQNKTYVETSSKCFLSPGHEYSLSCQPEECEVQPKTELFEYNYGPNYHPTFEVFLAMSVEEFMLGILDSGENREAWSRRRISLKGKQRQVKVWNPSEQIQKVNLRMGSDISSFRELSR